MVQYGIYLFMSQYMQLAMGMSPLEAGLAGLPSVGVLMIASNFVPKLARHVRPGHAIAGGLAVSAVGFFMLINLSTTGGLPLMIAAAIVLSVGVAPGMVLGTEMIVGSAPPERAGVASGMAETSNELGGALGIALLGSLGTAIYRHDVASAPHAARDTFAGAVDAAHAIPAEVLTKANDAFMHGLHVVAATNGLLMAAMAVVAAVFLRRVGGATAAPAAPAPAASPQPALATPALAVEPAC
jgi:DHA2 family multidrug resistance protein-like MFS transporter